MSVTQSNQNALKVHYTDKLVSKRLEYSLTGQPLKYMRRKAVEKRHLYPEGSSYDVRHCECSQELLVFTGLSLGGIPSVGSAY